MNAKQDIALSVIIVNYNVAFFLEQALLSVYKSKGIESIEVVDFIESMQETNFSLVTGVHVYDHLLKPLHDLQELRKNVSPGAHLAIVVHNEKSTLRKLLNSKWPPFCLQHPQLYNPKTLENLLRQSGWEVLKIEKSTNWYHLKYFVRMGFSVLGLRDRLSIFLPDIEFPIKLGNIICLAVRSQHSNKIQDFNV